MVTVGRACLILVLLLSAGIVLWRSSSPPANKPLYPPPPPFPPPPPPSSPPLKLPDYRLKWLGTGARAVSISGDWTGWATPGVPMERDETGAFAASIYLPVRCPRRNLIMRGVCCYRYKFYVDTGTRRRWLHDPRQPMDKDPDGWVNNFMCKYANGRDGAPLRMMPDGWRSAGKVSDQAKREAQQGMGGGGARGDASAAAAAADDGNALTSVAARKQAIAAAREKAAANRAAREAAAAAAASTANGVALPPPPPFNVEEVCLVLPATYFNGSTLSTTTTRGLGACCEMCRRRIGCRAYNWRPEPLARNCVLFGEDYGVARGTALCSAGLVRVPRLRAPTDDAPAKASCWCFRWEGERRRRKAACKAQMARGAAEASTPAKGVTKPHQNQVDPRCEKCAF